MKKKIIGLLSLIIVASLSGCADNSQDEDIPDSIGVIACFFENGDYIHFVAHRHSCHLLHYTAIIPRFTPISSVNFTHKISVNVLRSAN